jgi:hypothetical protein
MFLTMASSVKEHSQSDSDRIQLAGALDESDLRRFVKPLERVRKHCQSPAHVTSTLTLFQVDHTLQQALVHILDSTLMSVANFWCGEAGLLLLPQVIYTCR